jgi:dipeptidyl-peptidase-4
MFKIFTCSFFCFFLFLIASSQKKEFTYEQVFKDSPTNISKRLPEIVRWIDDEHYLERKNENKKSILVSVEAKSGREISFTEKADEVGRKDVGFPDDAKDISYSPDGNWAAYTRNHNLYLLNINTEKETQLTTDGNDDIYNGYAAWVYYEEMFGRSRKAFWWSPDSKHIAFIRFDETQVPVYSIFNSTGQHGSFEKCHYPQAGDKNPEVKLGVVAVDDPKIVWADFNEKDDQYLGPSIWSPDGSSLWAQWIPRNQHKLKIFSVDVNDGSKKQIYEEQQRTWVTAKYDIDFLHNNKQFIIGSDQSGWNHLYLYNIDGTLVNQITKGNFAVIGVEHIDEKNKIIYFLGEKENAEKTDLLKIGFDGKGLTRLTFGDYSHENISLSPTAKYFMTTYSNISSPPKMAIVDNNGKLIREIADSKGADYDNYDWAKKELHYVKSRDSLFDLPMIITYPLHFDPNKKYPVLIEMYGGPSLGTLHDRWSDDFREQWWAKEGLIQVTMDNRSSGHFGKAGENYIYEQMGKYEVEDFMDGAKWLRNQTYVDTTKICIMGFSFGGFVTCMALTYGAEVFTHGIAYYPVTDWSLYDSYYAERFMSTPQDNSDGYLKYSPIYNAPNYKGLLRIVHGDIDDNVHIQNTIQFADKLENLNKHFEMMIYPGERHGRSHWSEPKRTQSHNEDYKFIYDNLLKKPMPEIFWK